MKMSRRDRKMFNMGKQVGYYEGYTKGLHDGNPFICFAEALTTTMESLATLSSEQMQELLKIESEEEHEVFN